jgi:glycosyltransferase involved in cell wall biosynthesis
MSLSKSDKIHQLLIFDLSTGGHHASYIQHLVNYWQKAYLSGCLNIVVSPQFMTDHKEVVHLAANSLGVQFIPITANENANLKKRSFWLWQSIKEWQLCCRYAQKLAADNCLLMYFDTYQLPLALGWRTPCPVSGIYFRPTFHYKNFAGYNPSFKDKIRAWRQKMLLTRILRNPAVKFLFCLDPFVAESFSEFEMRAKMITLPDPVQAYPINKVDVDQLKSRLGIESGRYVFLFFGDFSSLAGAARKGLPQMCAALELLPESVGRQVCWVLVGKIGHAVESWLKVRLAQISQPWPFQFILCNEYIADKDIPLYFNLADVILAPYQRHVGMSGILVWAAMAQKPVLASDYGLMGEVTRRQNLGLVLNSSQPAAIAQGMQSFIKQTSPPNFDPAQVLAFARANSAQQYASTLFEHLW